MTFQLDFATIASILSFILAIAAILNMAIKEGERREAVKQMKDTIRKIEDRQVRYDIDNNENGKLLAGIKATLESLVESFSVVRSSLDKHISDTRGN